MYVTLSICFLAIGIIMDVIGSVIWNRGLEMRIERLQDEIETLKEKENGTK